MRIPYPYENMKKRSIHFGICVYGSGSQHFKEVNQIKPDEVRFYIVRKGESRNGYYKVDRQPIGPDVCVTDGVGLFDAMAAAKAMINLMTGEKEIPVTRTAVKDIDWDFITRSCEVNKATFGWEVTI